MKPVLSFARTGVLPSFVPNATTSSYTISSVAIVRTTSTSFITGTGLKKCKPTNRCGRLVAVAISVMVREDVLLAKIVAGGHIASSAPKSSRFAGSCSMIASTMTSQSLRSSTFVVPLSRPRISRFAASVIVPFSASRFRFLSMLLSPLSSNSALTSHTTVGNPDAAATCAMPDPIRPHPTTPTLRIAIFSSWKCHPPRRQEEPCNLAHRWDTKHRALFGCAQILPETKRLYVLRFACLILPRLDQRLDNHSDALPTADARRRQPIVQPIPPQLIQNRNHQPRSRSP